ncbi:MAG: hypothetical protein CO149_01515, partial [Nitrospirae bacterium CG_4_9_14_3_um_filter_51_5]
MEHSTGQLHPRWVPTQTDPATAVYWERRKEKLRKNSLALLSKGGNLWELIAGLWPSVILWEEEIQHSLPPR